MSLVWAAESHRWQRETYGFVLPTMLYHDMIDMLSMTHYARWNWR